MLIVFSDGSINFDHVKEISVGCKELTFWDVNDNMRVHTFNNEDDAREAYDRIINAIKDGERILDLRRQHHD